MAESSSSSNGINGATLLGILFIGLKLCHVIDWSWWWVTAPFWGGLAIWLVVLIIIGLFKLPGFLIERKRLKKFRESIGKKTINIDEKPKSGFAAKMEEMMRNQEAEKKNRGW